MSSALRTQVLQAYRSLLREARRFPESRTSRKLPWNIREVFELYRYENDEERIQMLLQDASKGEHVIQQLRTLPPEIMNQLLPEVTQDYKDYCQRQQVQGVVPGQEREV
eukprot:TRINITY_DN780_c0_g4_i1.p1 TRINITY_DN780_c0_g4~~TRINITY_DN780_c0_g4_i1.p1  ORF type:complete len:109 (-),score=15.00 TRINITY_DN780_c0_g4_i1:214-540(-)